jgi:hypothetical protein
VVLAHELEGRSFKEMATDTGVSVNTLLSRKRYAERPGEAPPNQGRVNDENVMTIFFVRT